jgi:hypothetical protein
MTEVRQHIEWIFVTKTSRFLSGNDTSTSHNERNPSFITQCHTIALFLSQICTWALLDARLMHYWTFSNTQSVTIFTWSATSSTDGNSSSVGFGLKAITMSSKKFFAKLARAAR